MIEEMGFGGMEWVLAERMNTRDYRPSSGQMKDPSMLDWTVFAKTAARARNQQAQIKSQASQVPKVSRPRPSYRNPIRRVL